MPPFCPMTIITFMIRSANTADAPVIREIYEPYVEEPAITFEYDVPSTEEFERRIENFLLSVGVDEKDIAALRHLMLE